MFAKAVALGALASCVAAQSTSLFFNTVLPKSFVAGQQATLPYTALDTSSPVTITLRNGTDSNNLGTVCTLTTTSTGGSYSWTPDLSLYPASTYALQLQQGSQLNYYGPFSISGGSTSGGPGTCNGAVASSSTISSAISSAPISSAPAFPTASLFNQTRNSSATTLSLSPSSTVPFFLAPNNTSTLPAATQDTSKPTASATKPTASRNASASTSLPASGAVSAVERSSNLALVLGGLVAIAYLG